MKKRLGKLELEVMKIIWKHGKATVREVWERLYPEKKLAYTTIATVIRKVEKKGFLRHEQQERTYVYYPLVAQNEVSQSMLKDLIDGIFDGSASHLISTLVRSDNLTDKDLAELQSLLREYSQEENND